MSVQKMCYFGGEIVVGHGARLSSVRTLRTNVR